MKTLIFSEVHIFFKIFAQVKLIMKFKYKNNKIGDLYLIAIYLKLMR